MSHLWSMVPVSCTQRVQSLLLEFCGAGETESDENRVVLWGPLAPLPPS